MKNQEFFEGLHLLLKSAETYAALTGTKVEDSLLELTKMTLTGFKSSEPVDDYDSDSELDSDYED